VGAIGVGMQIWNLTLAGITAAFWQALEHSPGLDRHIGVAGGELGGIGLGARL